MTSLDLQDMVGAAVVSALSWCWLKADEVAAWQWGLWGQTAERAAAGWEAEATAAEAMAWQQEHAAANRGAETLEEAARGSGNGVALRLPVDGGDGGSKLGGKDDIKGVARGGSWDWTAEMAAD
jgi:hypothetical protein